MDGVRSIIQIYGPKTSPPGGGAWDTPRGGKMVVLADGRCMALPGSLTVTMNIPEMRLSFAKKHGP